MMTVVYNIKTNECARQDEICVIQCVRTASERNKLRVLTVYFGLVFSLPQLPG